MITDDFDLILFEQWANRRNGLVKGAGKFGVLVANLMQSGQHRFNSRRWNGTPSERTIHRIHLQSDFLVRQWSTGPRLRRRGSDCRQENETGDDRNQDDPKMRHGSGLLFETSSDILYRPLF